VGPAMSALYTVWSSHAILTADYINTAAFCMIRADANSKLPRDDFRPSWVVFDYSENSPRARAG
jgi:hypothetical protein